MSIIIGILTTLEVIVCLLLSLVVLAQKPRQDGLGAAFGSGIMDQYAGAHATNVLQRATVYLGVALFALTFLLAILISRADEHKAGKLVDPSDLNKAKAAATTTTPAAGAQPTPAQAEALKKAISDMNANKAAGTKPAPAPASAPAVQKPADAKSATPAPAPAPAAQQKPANATPAPAPAPQKPADAAPAPAAPANK